MTNLLKKCGAVSLSLVLALAALPAIRTATAETSVYDFAPKTDPSGKLMQEVAGIDDRTGYTNIFDWNSNQETTALGYGTTVHEGETMRYIYGAGGDVLIRQMAQVFAGGASVEQADGLCFYLDATDLTDSEDTKISLRIALSDLASPDWYDTKHIFTLVPQTGSPAYIRHIEGDGWQEKTVEDSFVDLGEAFEGWVYLPVTSYLGGADDLGGTDAAVHPTATTFASFIALGLKYPCRLRMVIAPHNAYESATPVYFGDVSFMQGTTPHEHTMSEGDRVDATCVSDGYTVSTCSSCGEKMRTSVQPAAGHTLGAWRSDGDGVAYALCSACDHVETDAAMQNAPAGEDALCTVTFDYGDAGGRTVKKFRAGHVLTWADMPFKFTYSSENGWLLYQFHCWTTDADNLLPVNPVGRTVTANAVYYARYVVCNYSNKYVGAISFIAKDGGVYTPNQMGKIVVYGNSNPSLYHTIAEDFRPELEVLNNSVAGSTSHDMIEYYKALVLTYKPTMVVMNITTNDHAYYNMTDAEIMDNMNTLYEMTRRYAPNAVVVFTSALPLPGRTEYWEGIRRINNTMIEYASAHAYCEYVNTFTAAQDYANMYPVGWEFWTHLDLEGLRHTFSYLKTGLIEIAQKYGIEY